MSFYPFFKGKFQVFGLLSLLLFFFAACQDLDSDDEPTLPTDGISLSTWMSAIDDNTTINNIAIPGTHGSGTKDVRVIIYGINASAYAKTQSTTITEQLNLGVRFFDIRGYYDSLTSKIKVYHGVYDSQITVEEIVASMKTFLLAHPSELILFSIKVEKGNDFSSQFNANIIDSNPDLFYLGGDVFPALKSVRGKILLMRRGLSGIKNAMNLVISDNTTKLNGNIKVQDLYNPTGFSSNSGITRKISAITDFIPETKAGETKHHDTYLYINFTSQAVGSIHFMTRAYFARTIKSISQIANLINPKVLPKFTPNIRGIVAGDFVDKTYTKTIIKNNFSNSSVNYKKLEEL